MRYNDYKSDREYVSIGRTTGSALVSVQLKNPLIKGKMLFFSTYLVSWRLCTFFLKADCLPFPALDSTFFEPPFMVTTTFGASVPYTSFVYFFSIYFWFRCWNPSMSVWEFNYFMTLFKDSICYSFSWIQSSA